MVMVRFRKFLEMQNVKYDFSSVHIEVPEPLASDIIDWGKSKITDNEIFVSQTDPSFGREDEMHVTLLYGIHSETPDQVKELLEGSPKIRVELAEVDVFTNPEKFDVVVIKVLSDDMHKLNKKLTDSVEFTNKYKDYRPHATVAYVKKGKGWKYHGLKAWKGRKFEANYVIFSSKNGVKTKIAL
jgi:2'-5' RNA ligase